MLCLFLCAAMFVGLFVPLVPPLGVCVCCTSIPGGNQVDGLPPAPVIRQQGYLDPAGFMTNVL